MCAYSVHAVPTPPAGHISVPLRSRAPASMPVSANARRVDVSARDARRAQGADTSGESTVHSTRRCVMALRINSEAPNFTADTTQRTIEFHKWIGDGWAILFSHPKGLHAGVHHRAR